MGTVTCNRPETQTNNLREIVEWGFKLSNYGDSLKLRIPSYYWKIISGWSNDSEMVTTSKIHENVMGYRVSKSEKEKM